MKNAATEPQSLLERVSATSYKVDGELIDLNELYNAVSRAGNGADVHKISGVLSWLLNIGALVTRGSTPRQEITKELAAKTLAKQVELRRLLVK